jgi:uroporphyrinogen-III synthase
VKPLEGRTVVVTRPRPEADELARLFERRGARALVAPAIELTPVRSAALTQALAELADGAFAWLTLTSPRTVNVLAARLEPGQVRAKVAAVGEGTAEAFRRWTRRRPDLVPTAFTTASLARAFPRGGGRVLTPRADVAPEGLEQALERKGWRPTRVDAYRTRMPRSLPAQARTALRRGEVDAITFTSASTVRGFVRAMGVVTGSPKVVAIGPVTAREAREHGLHVHAVASPHTIEGLVAAVERVLRARRSAPARERTESRAGRRPTRHHRSPRGETRSRAAGRSTGTG